MALDDVATPAPIPASRLLAMADLEDLARRRYGKLSGGQKQRVTAPEEWTQVEIRLEDFPTATPEIIARLAFAAEGPVGGFSFEVDDVEVR